MPRPRSWPRFLASPPRAEARRVGAGQRHVHALGEVAAVVREHEAGLERHGGRRDQVAAAELERVDAELARGHVDDALDRVGRLRTPRAAVRACRRGVGEHAGGLHVDGRCGVDARDPTHVVGAGPRAARGEIGADVEANGHAQRQELAVAIEGQLGLREIVAPVLVADEALTPVRRPLDGPAQPLRGPEDEHVLRDRGRCACRSCRRPRRSPRAGGSAGP